MLRTIFMTYAVNIVVYKKDLIDTRAVPQTNDGDCQRID